MLKRQFLVELSKTNSSPVKEHNCVCLRSDNNAVLPNFDCKRSHKYTTYVYYDIHYPLICSHNKVFTKQ